MTIQNIDDVMDRIMSLNRNLNEDSLKVLLSASGWDREDISEGLRIFRSKSKSGVVATPISAKVFDYDPNQVKNDDNLSNSNNNITNNQSTVLDNSIPVPKPNQDETNKTLSNNNPYTFNLKNGIDNNNSNNLQNNNVVEQEDIVSDSISNQHDNQKNINTNPYIIGNKGRGIEVNNNISKSIPNHITEEITPEQNNKKNENQNYTKTLNQNIHSHNSHRGAKIIFYILLLIVLGFIALYLFNSNFQDILNNKLGTKTKLNDNLATQNIPNQNSNSQDNIPQNINTNNNPNQETILKNQSDINSLRNDLNNLQQQFANFKNTGAESKTIVKYISQRGPAGPSGRGILKAEATSTGFILTYTDGYQQIIPFATNTKLNNLNVEEICFRNIATTTEMTYIIATNTNQLLNSFDICLDKSQILNILQN